MPFTRTIRNVLQVVRAIQILLLAAVFIAQTVMTISEAHHGAAGKQGPSEAVRAVMIVSLPTLLFEAAALAVSITLFICTARPTKRAYIIPKVNAPLTACTSYCCDITIDTVIAALYGMSVVFNGAFMQASPGIGWLLGLDGIMMLLFMSTAVLSSRLGAGMLFDAGAAAVPLMEFAG